MRSTPRSSSPALPSLPQHDDAAGRERRAFQLSLARTAYNYVRSYPNLESVPLSAGVPPAEAFTLDYNALVARTVAQLSENFLLALRGLLQSELNADSPLREVEDLIRSYERMVKKLSWLHWAEDCKHLRDFFMEMTRGLSTIVTRMNDVSLDITKLIEGLEAASASALQEGPTGFLKSLPFDIFALARLDGPRPLTASSSLDFEKLIISLPKPAMLTIPKESWMPSDGPGIQDKPCQQDWFFGYLQVAGFNTTNLRAVVLSADADKKTVTLDALRQKMPLQDEVFADVIGEKGATLKGAAAAGQLFVVDYAALAPPVEGSVLHSLQRYVPAPVALFYWNPKPPAGYPPNGFGDPERPGVLQPVAIQLAQKHDADAAPIYTPKRGKHLDPSGHKWLLAKLLVNVACAIQHESVAHLGECHLVIEPIVLATHRQLAEVHPLYKLLWPHFRFTLPINDGAIHNLVIPGGVVAANVSPRMADTLGMIDKAHTEWRWDDNKPGNLFALRGVDGPALDFPFRDDTLRLWSAIHSFVKSYLSVYYRREDDLLNDAELQAWIGELVDPQRAAFQGMGGLSVRNGVRCVASLDYLVDVVAQIIYTAGPLHASVNYAQYALGSYAPAVAASSYGAPPTAHASITTDEACLPWCLPLDVALYTISFEYLLSSVQYDRLGHYDQDPRAPYFEDPKVHGAVALFQAALAVIETEIRARNEARPVPYPFQLPSQVPNSISI